MKNEHPYLKELIQYRMERARETLAAALLLHDQTADTASIVNRAYYAMFYAALAMLAAIDEQTSKHSGVLALFDKHFILLLTLTLLAACGAWTVDRGPQTASPSSGYQTNDYPIASVL